MININNKIRTRFNHWYHEIFCDSKLYVDMENTVEDSPWHRERNVGVHTNMVVTDYISRSGQNWDVYTLIGALVCAFHDTAKPMMEVVKHTEERGTYRAYSGHEQKSARLWEDYWTRSNDIDNYFPELTNKHKIDISWLIEYHVPFAVTRTEKQLNIARTVIDIFDRTEIFHRILLSDTVGRMSDDYETKHKNTEEWVFNFTKFINKTYLMDKRIKDSDTPILVLPIGASGTGKSTYYDNILQKDNMEYYSFDKFRLDWYVDGDVSRTREAFDASCADERFSSKVNSEFIKLIKSNNNIFIDNTNLTKKRRSFYCTEAHNRGYWVIAVIFPISIDELLLRQKNRGYKEVPENVVRRQYMSMQAPSIGAVDEVICANDTSLTKHVLNAT